MLVFCQLVSDDLFQTEEIAMNEEATRWLTQATQDLDTAQILFDAARYGPCAFFCQQTAEKTLKSVLYDVGERPWGHSLSSLLE